WAVVVEAPVVAATSSRSLTLALVPVFIEGGFGLACATALPFFGWTANWPTPPVKSPSCAKDVAAKARQRHAASAAELSVPNLSLFLIALNQSKDVAGEMLSTKSHETTRRKAREGRRLGRGIEFESPCSCPFVDQFFFRCVRRCSF